jgi:hypothetical protein
MDSSFAVQSRGAAGFVFHGGLQLEPAPAVIPAPIVYFKIVAVKTFVVVLSKNFTDQFIRRSKLNRMQRREIELQSSNP